MKKIIVLVSIVSAISVFSVSAMDPRRRRTPRPKPKFHIVTKKREVSLEQKKLQVKLGNFEKVMNYCSKQGDREGFEEARVEYQKYLCNLEELNPSILRLRRGKRIMQMMQNRFSQSIHK